MGLVQILFILIPQFFSIYLDQSNAQQQAPINRDIKIKFLVPNLPSHHYQFWLKNHPQVFAEYKQICAQVPRPLDLINLNYFRALHANLTLEDPRYFIDFDHGKRVLNDICTKIDLVANSCWGYENNCQVIHLMPDCHGSGTPKDLQDQKVSWFNRVDFGYILNLRRGMDRFCVLDKYSNDTWKSSLECTKHLKTCRGNNLMIHLKSSANDLNLRRNDLFRAGDIGGWTCDLQAKRILEEQGQEGPLQSWFNELKNYSLLTNISPTACDLTIDKQTIIVKLDTTDMYTYFSTFLNLYATIHLNNKFSEDNQIIVWDDLPRSKFDPMWIAFTRNPLLSIKQFQNKRVCLKKFVFAIPPKTVGGLYQDTELIKDCSKSGLFDAFNKHILHRLGIRQRYNSEIDQLKLNKTIRVTLVSRSTHHRNILNQHELSSAISAKSPDYQVSLIDFGGKSLREQLDIAQNTDILIGISSTTLTNSLFLPDWAALLELHNFGENTYSDLARLRGVDYYTPHDLAKVMFKVPVDDEKERNRLIQNKFLDHERYSNYRVHVANFLTIFEEAASAVITNRNRHFEARQSQSNVAVKSDSKEPRRQTHIEL